MKIERFLLKVIFNVTNSCIFVTKLRYSASTINQ
jgi:hypothetical protein